MSMELMHPSSVSVVHTPSMVISEHGSFTMHSLVPINSKMRGEKKNKSRNLNLLSFNFYPLPLGVTSSVSIRNHASSSGNNPVTEDEKIQFKSTFDQYLKEMESIRARRMEKKENEEKEKKSIISGGTEESAFRVEDVGIRSRRDGRKETLERKFVGVKGGNQLTVNSQRRGAIDEVPDRKRVIVRREADKSNKVGMGEIDEVGRRSEGDKDRLHLPELVDNGNGMYDGRRVTRMEMEERIQKLARSLNGADINMPEWMFSKMMREAQIRFSDHSILRVIQVLGTFGNWRRVLQVIEWLDMRERFKSHKLKFIYTAALDALGKAKRPVEALNLYHKMQEQRSTYPDIMAYHCIAVILGQAGHMKELFDIMDSMKTIPKNMKLKAIDNWEPRLKPDLVVYNAVLNACVKRKQWEGAFWVLQQLKQGGLQPSSTTYGLVMEVMMACGKYDLVHDFFKRVQKSSTANALTYRVVVNAFWREGRTNEAVEVVKEMERRGVVGSASVYYDLARCLCSAGRCEEALEQFDKMCKVATKPLVVSYTGMIQASLETGKVKDAAHIFTHMQKHCSPNLVTCNIMLKGFLEHKMVDEAKDLFLKMLLNERGRGRATPDTYTFNTILEGFVGNERWDDFEYAYEEMLRHGHRFNKKRHQWMVIKCSQAGKIGPLEATLKRLIKGDRIPSQALRKEWFLLKLETDDDLVAAMSTISSHPCASAREEESFSKGAWLELLNRVNKLKSVEKLLSQLEIKSENSAVSKELFLESLVEAYRELVKRKESVGAETDLFGSSTPHDNKSTS